VVTLRHAVSVIFIAFIFNIEPAAGFDPARALGMEVLDDALPALTLVTGDGARSESQAWQSKVVVLHFWASWCVPCRKELPELAGLAKAIAPNVEIVLVAIDEDKTPEALTAYARALGVELPIYIANLSTIPPVFWSRGVPATYIFNGPTQTLGRCLGPREWSRLSEVLIAMSR
jgi:thiol-disulfide isomerase/thioredoxin